MSIPKGLWNKTASLESWWSELYSKSGWFDADFFSVESAPPSGATCAVTITESSDNVDLTALGGEDYHILRDGTGLPSGYRKTGGGSIITVSEVFPSGWGAFNETKTRTYSASDATPTLSGSTNYVRTCVDFDGNTAEGGYQIDLPAGTGIRTAKIYVAIYSGGTAKTFKASATLSDSSASDLETVNSSAGLTKPLVIDVTYAAASSGQTLSIFVGTSGDTTGTAVATMYSAVWVSEEDVPSGTTITCNTGAATASGFQASVYQNTTIGCTLGSATAGGFAANVYQNVTINGAIANATASGFQALVGQNQTIAANLATANASGFTATFTISTIIFCNPSAADAVGFAARLNVLTTCQLAAATANGFTGNVAQNTLVQGTIGAAVANGFNAGVYTNITISCAIGAAVASGFNASVFQNSLIQCQPASATASGFTGNFRYDVVLQCTTGAASAFGYQATLPMSVIIACQPAEASANGFACNVYANVLLSCNIGQASAFGYSAAVVMDQVLACQPANADAFGYQSLPNYPTIIICNMAIADAIAWHGEWTGEGIVAEDDTFITRSRRIGRR